MVSCTINQILGSLFIFTALERSEQINYSNTINMRKIIKQTVRFLTLIRLILQLILASSPENWAFQLEGSVFKSTI